MSTSGDRGSADGGSDGPLGVRRLVRYDVLALSAAIWFLGKFLRYAFPPLFEPLQGEYGVSNAEVGIAFTGFMIVYAAMQFPSGVLADRLGAVRVITAGAAIAAAGSLVLVVDSPFVVLVAAMAVMGAGTGAHKTVAVRLLARVYPARTGRVLGAHDTVGTFGGIVAPAAVVLVVSPPAIVAAGLASLPGAPWRSLFLAAGVVVLLFAVAFALRVPDRLPDGADRASEGSETATAAAYLSLFRDNRFTAFVAVTILFSFAYNGTVAFLPLYLSQEGGLSTAAASLLYSVLFAMTFVQLVTGDLSDRIGRYPVIVATLGLAAVALSGLLLLPSSGSGLIAFGVAIVALGIGAHGFRPVRGAYLMELLPDWLAGGGLGVVRTLLMGAGAIAPAIVGLVADATGFRVAFGLLAFALAGAAALAAVLWLTESS